jgi:L-lysine exporter family protein LysE/ArgO
MTEAILLGLLTGMVMSVMLGTVFFALVQNSIDNGFRYGMLISLGVITSDLILISITLFNSNLIPRGGVTENIVRIFGTAFLLVYGINNLHKTKKAIYPSTKRGRIFYFFRTGFLLNILNPGNFLGWAVVATNITQVVMYPIRSIITFYIAAIIAIFGTEMLISFGALQLKRIVTDKILIMLDRSIGVLFIGFAFVLIWPVILSGF